MGVLRDMFINILASCMMTKLVDNEETLGIAVTPKNVVFDLKQQAKQEAIKKIQQRIITTRGPEMHDWRPTNSCFQPPSKAERKAFIKAHKKQIKNGSIIIIKSHKEFEKHAHRFYEANPTFNYVPLNYNKLPPKEKKDVLNDLRKTSSGEVK